jgi:hypothetical protein
MLFFHEQNLFIVMESFVERIKRKQGRELLEFSINYSLVGFYSSLIGSLRNVFTPETLSIALLVVQMLYYIASVLIAFM